MPKKLPSVGTSLLGEDHISGALHEFNVVLSGGTNWKPKEKLPYFWFSRAGDLEFGARVGHFWPV